MGKGSKILEVSTNIAILCVCVLVAVIGVNKFLLHHPDPTQAAVQGPAVGSKFAVKDVNWARSKRTVVLGIRAGCHFCSDSAVFYQRLTAEAARHNVPVIAVLPGTTEENHQYLTGLGLPALESYQMPLGELKIAGTPTLVVVDEKGVVRKTWVGKLPPETEKDVLAELQ